MKFFAIAAFMGLASLGLPAHAQLTTGGGPIQITAETLDVRNAENRAIYMGNVDALQGDARLRTDRLTVVFGQSQGTNANGLASPGPLERLVADGEVFYITPEQEVRSDRAVYDATLDTIIMTGNVIVTNPDGVITGEKLTIEIGNERFVMSGTEQSSGRVTSVIETSNGQ